MWAGPAVLPSADCALLRPLPRQRMIAFLPWPFATPSFRSLARGREREPEDEKEFHQSLSTDGSSRSLFLSRLPETKDSRGTQSFFTQFDAQQRPAVSLEDFAGIPNPRGGGLRIPHREVVPEGCGRVHGADPRGGAAEGRGDGCEDRRRGSCLLKILFSFLRWTAFWGDCFVLGVSCDLRS